MILERREEVGLSCSEWEFQDVQFASAGGSHAGWIGG